VGLIVFGDAPIGKDMRAFKAREAPPNTGTTTSLGGLRILILLEWLEVGGAERQAVLLANVLRVRHGADVEVWGFGRRPIDRKQVHALVPMCERLGVTWRDIDDPVPAGWRQRIAWLARFERRLRHVRPDVLLPYCALPNIVGGLLWRGVGARTCVWGQRDEGRNRPPRFLEALAVAATPWFIGNSQDGVEFLTTTLHVSAAHIQQIRNGVMATMPQSSRSAWRERLGIGAEVPLAVMVANLHRFKDHATLIEAWALVRASTTGLAAGTPVLALAGYHAGAADDLQRRVRDLGLADLVQFLGQVEDVAGLLAAADLCVHSSRFEGIPNAILEAMAMGLPVVATDIRGAREALGPNGDEWLSPPADATALARCLVRLIRDDRLRTTLGKQNWERAMSEFQIRRLGEETASLIHHAITHSEPWSLAGSMVTGLRVMPFSLLACRVAEVGRNFGERLR
jgi:glycosyltransferase involved in cell wall biosynthesis